jgi:predicted transcriptional regulator
MIWAHAMTDEKTSRVMPAQRQRRRAGGARRSRHKTAPVARETVSIELSNAQVDQVVRAASQGGTMSVLLSALEDPRWTPTLDSDEWPYPTQMDDRRLSRSLLSGLLVLSCFPVDGAPLGIAELARRLDMNTSTTHRYVSTLLAVGLLERDPDTRRYRLAGR